MLIEPTYTKYFKWNKSELKYNLTRTLKFDFSRNQVLMNQKVGWIEIIYISKKKDTVWVISAR